MMISLDDTVVVRTLTDTNSQLQILKAASDQKMGKSRVSLKDTVGQRLGSLFELTNRKYENAKFYDHIMSFRFCRFILTAL